MGKKKLLQIPHKKNVSIHGGKNFKQIHIKKKIFLPQIFFSSIYIGVLPVNMYPTFDEEQGLLANVEETEEETEIELNPEEPQFLRGQTRQSKVNLSPVR